MADVLSQKQIDELLNSFNQQGDKAFEEIEENTEKIKVYDFKMPKKFTKEQLKVIESIFENYSRVLSSYITSLMRLYCKVEVIQIEEQRYYEFNNALPDYVMMAMINMGIKDEDILETIGIMQVSNPIAFTMMDRLMGGDGAYTEVNRDFTEIEVGLMTNVMTRMAKLLKEPWGQYIDLEPALTNVETNSRVMQSISPDEVIILVMLEIEIKDVKNTMSICIPAINLESIMSKFGDRWARETKRMDPKKEEERRRGILDTIKDTRLKIDAVLCETKVDFYDILTLQVDDVIPLNMPIDKNIAVKIGNSMWFDGKLGVKDNKKAIKIDNVYKELR
ncbi:MAG: flagellar motor switch protein FliM [Oscillospiraceae bacterium]|nr:flagellar motor switch protein FliM [Oscillospiraceae bacterium]MBQ4312466.1 flagellar motor switch protein FliM [Oscillospiraceae bacterium]MCR5165882.1 flagellar motor switch protein FliM [Oscillospiraceae bacterium]